VDAILLQIKSQIGKRKVNPNDWNDIELVSIVEVQEGVVTLDGKVVDEEGAIWILLLIEEYQLVNRIPSKFQSI
jgi:hypothetical protein